VILGASGRMRVFVYREPVDMRKAYDTLSALVIEPMKKSLLSGDVFVFIGRTRKRAKALYFDGTGLCLLCNQPSSHYASFGSRRGPWSPLRDAWVAAARSLRRSQRLQCFAGRAAGSS
jgi:hypothetical protein